MIKKYREFINENLYENKKIFMEDLGIVESQFSGKTKIEKDLYINTKFIPDGFNPNVVGSISIKHDVDLPKGFSPIVSGALQMKEVTKIPENFKPVIGQYLNAMSVKSVGEGFAPQVGTRLFLNSLKELPRGFAPSVGDDMLIYSLYSQSGIFDLSGVKEITIKSSKENMGKLTYIGPLSDYMPIGGGKLRIPDDAWEKLR